MKVAQSCPTLCDPMDCIVHWIFQARILEWVAFAFSRGSSQPRDWTQVSNPGLLHCRWVLYQLSHQGKRRTLECVAYPFSRGSSLPRNQTGVFCIAGRFFTNWAMREALKGKIYSWDARIIQCMKILSVWCTTLIEWKTKNRWSSQ